MFKFIIKRLGQSAIILFFVMFIVYALMYSMPTSYVEQTARELATKPGTTKSAQQWIEELNAQYGMDKGIVVGYFTWLKSAVTGEFGDSWWYTKPVVEQFRDTIWYSFAMGGIAFVLQVVIAVPLGVLAARKQYSITDYTVTVLALVGISLPTFFLATILKLVFAVHLGWFEISGMMGRDFYNLDAWGQFLDIANHMVLPIVTIVLVSVGSLMRLTRTNMLEELNADYIRMARAKGVPESKVISRHAFRNTLIPLVTILGASLPVLFSGALITETIFAIRGIGWASYYSMVNGDIPFTMFYLAFIAILTLLGNLIADILYAAVDPRVRVN